MSVRIAEKKAIRSTINFRGCLTGVLSRSLTFFGGVSLRLRWEVKSAKEEEKPQSIIRAANFGFYLIIIWIYLRTKLLRSGWTTSWVECRKKLLMKNLVRKTDLRAVLLFFVCSSANIYFMENTFTLADITLHREANRKGHATRRDKIRLSKSYVRETSAWSIYVICIANLSAVFCVHSDNVLVYQQRWGCTIIAFYRDKRKRKTNFQSTCGAIFQFCFPLMSFNQKMFPFSTLVMEQHQTSVNRWKGNITKQRTTPHGFDI